MISLQNFKITLSLTTLLIVLSISPFAPFTWAEAKTDNKTNNKPNKQLSGGAGSVFKKNRNAFSQPMTNMPITNRLDFSVGNSFFKNPWVTAPATTTARDGLGPLFNTNGCQNCHIKDGRGHAPEGIDDIAVSLLVRLSVPAQTDQDFQTLITDGAIPEPNYGGQLQDFSISGVAAEGQVNITYQKVTLQFADGEKIDLRKPNLTIANLGYGDMHENVMLSARIAPPMIGLGLLEAVPESQILQWQDKNDTDKNLISGVANQVWNKQTRQTEMGRFGWKAGQPTLLQQNAAAFNGDIGITSSLFSSENCSPTQSVCTPEVSGGEIEIEEDLLEKVTFYSQNLAVPARRSISSPDVLRGYTLFKQANCHSCHREMLTTGKAESAWLSHQTIFPYTDLLLHDMGEGLSDNRPEFTATGREWRTAPLWGIGLTATVTGKHSYLHDGRAQSLMEAILWHEGEAKASQQFVLNLAKDDREQLIKFLESL